MNEVMVDNWLLEDIVDHCNSPTVPDSLGVLLSAIVLWENVHYPMNPMSFFWSERDVSGTKWFPEINSIRNALSFFVDSNEEFSAEQKLFFRNNRDLFEKNTSEVIAAGALRYLSLSNKQGFDYLPCAERREFISKYPDVCRKSINRIDTLSPLEKEIDEFLDDLSSVYKDSYFSIKRPVLVNYIINNTPDDMSSVDYAFHLKNEGPVVAYRRYLVELEKAFNKQDLRELSRLRTYSKEVVQGIINMDVTIGSADFSILPLPGISLTRSIDIAKKIHLTFLEDLARFSLSGV